MAKITPTFYVFHGEDEYTRKAELNEMRAKMNDPAALNIGILAGGEASAQGLINAVSAIPFLSDKRLVIVEGYLEILSKRGKAAEAEYKILEEGLPRLPDFARLVFHENITLSDKNPIIKLINSDPHGYVKAFNAPRDTTRWIEQQV
jgi:DNA polymerase III delta subunit